MFSAAVLREAEEEAGVGVDIDGAEEEDLSQAGDAWQRVIRRRPSN
jgi:8-oxo-dGTP pyrophosphatase MutT (NUDIX family)